MNYQEFFKDRKNCVVFPCVPGPELVRDKQIDFTVEELYQAFEARLIDKLVVMGPSLIACGKLVSKKELGVET